jgi:hypothetical protein
VVGYAAEAHLTLVARGETREITAYEGDTAVWHVDGVANPSAIVTGARRAVVLDALANRAVVVNLQAHHATSSATPESPVAAAVVNDQPFILCRDDAVLIRLADDGSVRRVSVDPGSSNLLLSAGRLLIYSRINGSILEVDPASLTVVRRGTVAPFASDIEADDRNAYLTYPSTAEVIAFDLATFRSREPMKVGAVPTDLALIGGSTILSAGTVAVADPSSKRIWRAERMQSLGAATGRGFLRGLIGLGLYRPSSSQFPTGVDRVWSAGKNLSAFDSATSTLYKVGSHEVKKLGAFDVTSFAFADDGVVVWNDKSARLLHIR